MDAEAIGGLMAILAGILILVFIVIPLGFCFGILWMLMLYFFIGPAAAPLGLVLGFLTAIGWILQER